MGGASFPILLDAARHLGTHAHFGHVFALADVAVIGHPALVGDIGLSLGEVFAVLLIENHVSKRAYARGCT